MKNIDIIQRKGFETYSGPLAIRDHGRVATRNGDEKPRMSSDEQAVLECALAAGATRSRDGLPVAKPNIPLTNNHRFIQTGCRFGKSESVRELPILAGPIAAFGDGPQHPPHVIEIGEQGCSPAQWNEHLAALHVSSAQQEKTP